MIGMLIAAALAFAVSILGTPLAIRWLSARDVGQFIQEELKGHFHKHGTPTMGGLVIVVAVISGYSLSHLRVWSPSSGVSLSIEDFTPGGLLALGAVVGMGLIGLLDDFLKVSRETNMGLNKRAKFLGQLSVAGLFAWGAVEAGVPTQISLTRPFGAQLTLVAFGLWVLLLLGSTANAVNITDGLDGLASGSAAFVFGAYGIMTFWIFRNPRFYGEALAEELSALDLAWFAAAMLGAVLGFLWWNAPPARIIMGDVGSHSLGGGMAALAVLTNTHLLLIVLGGLYVIETVTVIIQVASFRLFGRRVFLMTPIHHHFELKGWPETTVIVRFWIVAGLGVALGLGIFYGDFLTSGGIVQP